MKHADIFFSRFNSETPHEQNVKSVSKCPIHIVHRERSVEYFISGRDIVLIPLSFCKKKKREKRKH